MSTQRIKPKTFYSITKVKLSVHTPAIERLRTQRSGLHKLPCNTPNQALGRIASIWTGFPDATPRDPLFQAEQYLLKAEKEKEFDDDYVRSYLEALMKFATETRSTFDRSKALFFYGRFTYLLKQVEKTTPPPPSVPLGGFPSPTKAGPVVPAARE